MAGQEIRSVHEVSETHEISAEWNGFNFLVIFGRHVNGWFIAIPNWGTCTESGDPKNVSYNAEKLAQTRAFKNPNAPKAIAEAIAEYWECWECI